MPVPKGTKKNTGNAAWRALAQPREETAPERMRLTRDETWRKPPVAARQLGEA